jgi:hypothetical protein
MDQELQKLIRQLQDQQCPPAVMERVVRRIARDKKPRLSVAWGVSIVCLVGAIAFWHWQVRREARLLAAAQVRADRAVVVQQAQEAFGYIGQALIRAAAHTENALSKEAVPPLRNSFETVKNKITKPI